MTPESSRHQRCFTLLHTSYREMNPKEPPMTQNKPYWKPEVMESLAVDVKDFKAQALNGGEGTIILDVRSQQEFALRNVSQTKGVQARVANIEWTEFFGDKGLPKKQVENILLERGISKDTKILLISNHGVRSGAAAYALDYLGYKKVSNFAGGYEQWK